MSNDRALTDACYAKGLLAGRLERDGTPAAITLASKFRSCRQANPCLSAACPECGASFQNDLETVVAEFIVGSSRQQCRGRRTLLTIVPESGRVPPDQLSVADFERVYAEVSAALIAAGCPPCIGTLELSFEEHENGRIRPHWRLHFHAITLEWLSSGQEQSLKKRFLSSVGVRRPVQCVPMDDETAGRRYPFKWQRNRRQRRRDKIDADGNSKRRRPRRKALRPHQAVELALVEHQFGFARRLIIHGNHEGAVWRRLRACPWARDSP